MVKRLIKDEIVLLPRPLEYAIKEFAKNHLFFILLWWRFLRRYGQVVRQWIANPLSPVRIWVSPKIVKLGGMVEW